ncbi:hypothetical protein HAP48_0042640 [Bradyrhizobium septentrionale]|uniref:DUF2158 domain-containing protein n=1 Tax=Bradyrhizobium septentrionale TaxID=1404411 RepID=A0A974A3M2_9BRAD|nr:hypothetical protein [Bradyrhizobium septentrionale]UGY15158.1 hypothetical protein HAP48_0042640 [Bradyrhizobium septentrionale]
MAEVRVDIESASDVAIGDVVAMKGQPYTPMTVIGAGDNHIKVMWLDLKRQIQRAELHFKTLHKVTSLA